MDYRITTCKPFVKWAGGKTQLLSTIQPMYPADLGKGITKYAEPFIGGGAVLFDILSKYELEEVYISDVNERLIKTYRAIQGDVERLIECLDGLAKDYLAKTMEERKVFYYEQRDLFNTDSLADTEQAALFIFLNRTCFNGLYRVNSQGLFNVPSGRYKNPSICDEKNLRAVSRALSHVQIVCGSYELSGDFIDDKTFVYFDPPYRPLTESAAFTSYAKDGFTEEDQIKLADFVKLMKVRGAKVLFSNSDPHNVDATDHFFDDLFEGFNIDRVKASRMINSKGTGRGKITELLIANY